MLVLFIIGFVSNWVISIIGLFKICCCSWSNIFVNQEEGQIMILREVWKSSKYRWILVIIFICVPYSFILLSIFPPSIEYLYQKVSILFIISKKLLPINTIILAVVKKMWSRVIGSALTLWWSLRDQHIHTILNIPSHRLLLYLCQLTNWLCKCLRTHICVSMSKCVPVSLFFVLVGWQLSGTNVART